MALASASFTKCSAFASQVRGRCSFIAIQLTMHAAFARCATGAGANGCWRDFTHSSQFLWCERLCGICTVTPLGSSSFGSLASSDLSDVVRPEGSLAVCDASRETKIQPSVPMNLIPFGSSSDTVIFTLPGYVSSTWYLPCTFQ